MNHYYYSFMRGSMKRAGIIIPLFILLFSCEEEVARKNFIISVQNFEFADTLLTEQEEVPEFNYQFAGGVVNFTDENNKTFKFDTENTGIEEYIFELPYGEYFLETEIPPASLYGQERATFKAGPVYVEISHFTDTVSVNVEPTCAHIVIGDKKNQLDKGAYIIRRHPYSQGYFTSYPLALDSLRRYYYTYVTPDTVPDAPYAFLWFYDEEPGIETGGLPTKDFEIGYRYLIKVLE